ncbi:molecular chaperone DnaK [candidate division WWE3 bacterium CG08_land_8_20_14_0_20_43_13]|uniref:Chaperone protein DnaK n=1 Tax=candidate division WWE3 bacterium CG08_land_8_20_14_0_20_43_13 TaxID=1975087 RepID=A0A2H0X7Z4_UNCKA|nr:MAG: molecular chaperone DnaK [candidate division WWE3 bacterium CG08_land_8_20_14_0_20_43_13]
MSKILGIDLGTTNSCMAVMEGGQPKVIPNAEGNRLTPSVVEPVKNLVGQVAKRQQVVNSKNTIYSVKRLMGRRYGDEAIKKAQSTVPYEIVQGSGGLAVVQVEGNTYTPQEVSAKILAKMKADAEAFLGEKVIQAVITVPAYFDDGQRSATKEAGKIAGLEVLRIVNEPTAAALAYGLDKNKSQKIAVYDLGGGTFDISILEIGDGVFEVKATNGDTYLGGDDWDNRVIQWLLEDFKKEQGVDLSGDKQAMQRLKDSAEKAKIELSTKQDTEINIPYITADANGPKHMLITLTRSKLEQLTDDLLQKSIDPCKKALADSGLSVKEIDEVVLVGGMTRMPKVVDSVRAFFGREPHKGVNPDEVVGIGAAIQAGVLGGDVKDLLLLDVTPLTLGLETLGGVRTPLIERNTTIPTGKTQVFSTAADNQTSVEIHVLQGEREMASDNKSLGRFVLEGLPPAPRGIPQVEVTFDLDANGILSVSAKDKATNREQKITIQGATGLSKEEVERLRQEAEKYSQEDNVKKEQAEARNIADNLCYSAEKGLREAGDKVDEATKKEIEEKVKDLRDMSVNASTEELKKKTEELSVTVQKIGQAMYSSQTSQGQPGTDGAGSGQSSPRDKKPEDEVKEGEVVE